MFHVGQKVWREIIGYEGLYAVSSDGEVKSLRSGNILKGSPVPNGYLTIALHKAGIQNTKTIHRLVATAFHQNPEAKPTVNHIDGVRTNNRAANLEWATFAENTRNGVDRGTVTGRPRRLSQDQRDAIRTVYSTGGISQRRLAAQYGITKSAITYIMRVG